MKQAEINKKVDAAIKEAFKGGGWKTSSGFSFKKVDDLFYFTTIVGVKNPPFISGSLWLKWYDFDDLFWDIVGLPENKTRPLSFHASGAWVAHAEEIEEIEVSVAAFEDHDVFKTVKGFENRFNEIVTDNAATIKGIDAYIDAIRRYYMLHREKYPDSLHTIDMHELLYLIVKNDMKKAVSFIDDRIKEDSSGGFESGDESFYELAKKYIRNTVKAR